LIFPSLSLVPSLSRLLFPSLWKICEGRRERRKKRKMKKKKKDER